MHSFKHFFWTSSFLCFTSAFPKPENFNESHLFEDFKRKKQKKWKKPNVDDDQNIKEYFFLPAFDTPKDETLFRNRAHAWDYVKEFQRKFVFAFLQLMHDDSYQWICAFNQATHKITTSNHLQRARKIFSQQINAK